jgi:hypothetical protein
MAKPPEGTEIPTLTRLVKAAVGQPPVQPPAATPVVPSPGLLPADLDIDLQLGELDQDEPEHSLLPPQPEVTPPVPPDPTADEAFRTRVEALVDQALAERMDDLREEVRASVLRALSERTGNNTPED